MGNVIASSVKLDHSLIFFKPINLKINLKTCKHIYIDINVSIFLFFFTLFFYHYNFCNDRKQNVALKIGNFFLITKQEFKGTTLEI